MSREADSIVKRMDVVRSKRARRVASLTRESNRLTDWREHVRSAPLLTLAASIAVGALGASTLTAANASDETNPENSQDSLKTSINRPRQRRSMATSVASAAWSFAMPLAVAFFKQQVSAALNNNIRLTARLEPRRDIDNNHEECKKRSVPPRR